MFFYIVLTPISTTSCLKGTDKTREYHQIDVYIYQCDFCVRQFVLRNTINGFQQHRLIWILFQFVKMSIVAYLQ